LYKKINKNIEEIENKLLAFDVSCEEDLIAMGERLSATKETKTESLEQIQALEEQRKSLEDKIKLTAENAGEVENRVQKLEDSYNIERVEKIDAFMTQKTEIKNFLIRNVQEMDRQKSEFLNIQETINHSEDHLQKIQKHSDNLDTFVANTREEYDKIHEMIDKAVEEFDEYAASQREQTQKIGEDFKQTIQSLKDSYQKQLNTMAADEMEYIKKEIKLSENGALENMNRTKEALQEYLEEGKQTLSKHTNTGVQEMEGMIKQTKSDMADKWAEIETAHQEQVKTQKIIEGEKNLLDKNLKVSKWMMIINVMVMVLTVTVLFLSLFF